MRPRLLPALLAALATTLTAPPAQVTVTLPGADPVTLATVTVRGLDHVRLDDLLACLRRVDGDLGVSWENAQTLRLRVLGTRVSLFTDSTFILVEARLHRTAGPLVNVAGVSLVPASVVRDLFDLLPGAEEIEVELLASSAAPAPQIPPPLEPEPRPVAQPRPAPLPPMPQPQPLPLFEGHGTFSAGSGIALICIASGDDAPLIAPTADLLEQSIRRGTRREVRRIEAVEGQWEQALISLESADPLLVVGLQVGHSAHPGLTGAAVYQMSPLVDLLTEPSPASRLATRYRASAHLSDLLSSQVAGELQRTHVAWLGRLSAPHRLLRACESPAVIVELGQASNSHDRERLESASYQAEIAGAVAQAVIDLCAQIPPREEERL